MIKRTDLLSIDLNLKCNLMCEGCNKYVYPMSSDAYEMTVSEMVSIMQWVVPQLDISYIRLIGGEPLAHPDFSELVYIIKLYYPSLGVEIATNGLLLSKYCSKYGSQWLKQFCAIKITDYGPKNARAIGWVKAASPDNVVVINSMDTWRDSEEFYNLSEEDGRLAYKRCPMGTIKVCNRKMWDCCAAEAIERHFELPDTSVPLIPAWKRDLDNSSRATTCQHCYFGDQTIKDLKETGEYDRIRQ